MSTKKIPLQLAIPAAANNALGLLVAPRLEKIGVPVPDSLPKNVKHAANRSLERRRQILDRCIAAVEAL